MSEVLLLMNERSGRVATDGPDAIEASLRSVIEEAGREARFVRGAVPALLDALHASDAGVVATIGGDGTIGAVASVLAERDAPPLLVPLPYGTANLIPRDLGMPMDPGGALRASLAAPATRIDHARANESALLHSAVFGTFAEIAEDREALRAADGVAEMARATAHGAATLLAAAPATYHLTVDGAPLDATTNAVFVTNNAVTGGERGVPVRDRLDAGELVVYLSDGIDAAGFVRTLIEAVTGGFDGSRGVIKRVCRTATIEAEGAPLVCAVDGEVVRGEARMAFEIVPRALSVPRLR